LILFIAVFEDAPRAAVYPTLV